MKFNADIALHLQRLFAFVAMAVCVPQLQAGPSEPESHGRPLSYWLEHCIGEEQAVGEAAIREIGTNGLPAMLVWLRYEPSQTKTEIMQFLRKMRASSYGGWIPPELTYDKGVPPGHVGFYVLGPAAASAIPELAQIANDANNPRPAARAMMALSSIGPAALKAVEARLVNPNFPFPPDAAVNMYLRTRTSTNYNRLSAAEVRPLLIELQTNANPRLVQGATQLLDKMALPSMQERGQTKRLSEALLDLRTEREMGGGLKPGWNIHPRDKLSPEEQLAASNAVYTAMTKPPALPKGDEPYPYPLQPGTDAWNYAEVEERIQSIEIPKSWRAQATSWQLFRSAIGNPYFSGGHAYGSDVGKSYQASRSDSVSILQEVDSAPEFGTNVLRWLSELDLVKMTASECDKPYEPCQFDYILVWHMAGLDSALGTLDMTSRQRLYRMAVWDADYFLSRSEDVIARGPVEFAYAFGGKPEGFRGHLPPGAILSPPSASKSQSLVLSQDFNANLGHLRSSISAAKAALGLAERP